MMAGWCATNGVSLFGYTHSYAMHRAEGCMKHAVLTLMAAFVLAALLALVAFGVVHLLE